MPSRVLDWFELVRIAERRNPPDRVIAIAGVPARVVPHLATDAGFYVRTVDEDDSGAYWSLRKAPDLVLLRALVDAGVVTVEDDDDAWRLAEWHRRRAGDERCFIAGCSNGEIDARGPVFDTAGRMHLACPDHWAAIHAVTGAQDTHRED